MIKRIIIATYMLALLLQIAAAQFVPFAPVADHCFDTVKNGNEQGLNCGGDCLPCGPADTNVNPLPRQSAARPDSAAPVPAAPVVEEPGFLTSPLGVVVQVIVLLVVLFILFAFIEHARKAAQR